MKNKDGPIAVLNSFVDYIVYRIPEFVQWQIHQTDVFRRKRMFQGEYLQFVPVLVDTLIVTKTLSVR
jgi:hypothetical protein